jgi:hypothetical protein
MSLMASYFKNLLTKGTFCAIMCPTGISNAPKDNWFAAKGVADYCMEVVSLYGDGLRMASCQQSYYPLVTTELA